MCIDIHRNDQLDLVWHSWACPKNFKTINQLQMSFDRYPKREQIVPEFSIKWDQVHLGMLLTNQIKEFMKIQYLQNNSRDELDFLYAYVSKGATI